MKKCITIIFALLLLAACKNKKVDHTTVAEVKPITEAPVAEETKNKTLLDTKWQPIEILGDTKMPAFNTAPYFQLTGADKENPARLGGHGGCNRFFGEYETSGNKLKVSNIGSTKMYCQETSDIEAKFFQALQKGETYEIKKDTLILYAGNEITGKFIAVSGQ